MTIPPPQQPYSWLNFLGTVTGETVVFTVKTRFWNLFYENAAFGSGTANIQGDTITGPFTGDLTYLPTRSATRSTVRPPTTR